MTKFRLLPIILLLSVTACGIDDSIEIPEYIEEVENLIIYPIDAKPAYKINLHREIHFGDSDDEFFGSIRAVAVDGNGRLFISDGSQQLIHGD